MTGALLGRTLTPGRAYRPGRRLADLISEPSLNVRGRFASAAVAPSLYNISIILGAVLLGPVLGVEGLAVGVVIGSLLHLAIQIRPLIRERFRLTLKIDLSDPAVRQILTLK